jgi:hypothetical protein
MRALVAAIMAVAVVVPLATASEPIRREFVTIEDQIWGPCPDGSVVYAHLTWDISQTRFPDRIQSVIRVDHTFTNSATGLSIRSFANYFAVLYLDPASETGSSGAFEAGSFGKLVLPGAGLVSNTAGRLTYNADGDIIRWVGVQNGHSFDLCTFTST